MVAAYRGSLNMTVKMERYKTIFCSKVTAFCGMILYLKKNTMAVEIDMAKSTYLYTIAKIVKSAVTVVIYLWKL